MPDYLRHPLDSCFERVWRADEHLAELQREIAIVFEKQANAAGIEFDPHPPHRAKVSLPSETFFGMRIATLTGEIFYNLRTALDYLVFELAQLDSGIEQSGTQFPIMDAKQDFDGRGKAAFLKGVNLGHIACIERLQPYNGCDWTRRLRDCSNADKHRHFIASGGAIRITVHSSLERDDLVRTRGFERKAPHPLTGRGVDVKVHIAGQIAFPDGAPVRETIEEIKMEVANTLVAFKPDF
jgi:hypothetical protein